MIFSIEGHIQKIIDGTKYMTRRPTDTYKIGKFYAIQPGRGKKGIPDGKIYTIAKRLEIKTENPMLYFVLPDEALAEGGYMPEEFEELYEDMYPSWKTRYCYLFRYWSTENIERMERGEFPILSLKGSEVKQT